MYYVALSKKTMIFNQFELKQFKNICNSKRNLFFIIIIFLIYMTDDMEEIWTFENLYCNILTKIDKRPNTQILYIMREQEKKC